MPLIGFENADFWKTGNNFFQNFLWVNFGTETKIALKMNIFGAGQFFHSYLSR
jgi:hypothetical protein